LYKHGDTTPLDSTELIKFKRDSNLFSEKNYAQRFFIASNEKISCFENIVDKSLGSKLLTSGSYYVDGYVKFDDQTYKFLSDDILTITTISDNEDTPGFEILIVIFAIALVLLWKRKMRV
jgi:hypothetical protein